jgi:hypothetical protein
MKRALLLFLIGFIIVGCRKDKVPIPIPDEDNYYHSKGNLLILLIGEKLEGAYEYELNSTQLTNDSLPIIVETVPDVYYDYQYYKFAPNPDTLFWNYSGNFTFMSEQIQGYQLMKHGYSLPLKMEKFQVFGSGNNIDYSKVWAEVSDLAIVRTYRNINPNSKIGISRFSISEFDEAVGFSVPTQKYVLYFAK